MKALGGQGVQISSWGWGLEERGVRSVFQLLRHTVEQEVRETRENKPQGDRTQLLKGKKSACVSPSVSTNTEVGWENHCRTQGAIPLHF